MSDLPYDRPYLDCCMGHGYHWWWCLQNEFRDENIRQRAIFADGGEAEVRHLAALHVAAFSGMPR